jgi:hypothetical protein
MKTIGQLREEFGAKGATILNDYRSRLGELLRSRLNRGELDSISLRGLSDAHSDARGWLLRAFDVGSNSLFFRSDTGLPEDAVQGVNTAVITPVLFNYLAKAVVPAAHG